MRTIGEIELAADLEDVAPEVPRLPLTAHMIEAMLSAPDLEEAMGSTAADMVAGGWTYPEAMVAIAVAFGERLRKQRAILREIRPDLDELVALLKEGPSYA